MVLNDDADVGVELEYVNVEIISRLELLYLTVSEFASAFGGNKGCLDTIKKGVKERQIIEKIKLFYYDQTNNIQGFIILKIDWDKYEINLKDDKNRTFSLDTSKPLLTQLDQSVGEIINHVKRMRKELQIYKIKTIYTYRSIYRSGEKCKEADRYLNLVDAEKKNVQTNDKFERSMKICLSKLNELEINIYSEK